MKIIKTATDHLCKFVGDAISYIVMAFSFIALALLFIANIFYCKMNVKVAVQKYAGTVIGKVNMVIDEIKES